MARQAAFSVVPQVSAESLAQISDGEYRTLLAAQRTLLAFLRTALAVLVVFRDSALGPVLASLVALMGIAQFATAAPLFLSTSRRVPKDGGGSRADAAALFHATRMHSWMVGVLVLVCAAVAIPWRYNNEVESIANAADFDAAIFD